MESITGALVTFDFDSMILGILDSLMGFHTGLAQPFSALHTVTISYSIVLAAGAPLLEN